jgi:hypothetical protein
LVKLVSVLVPINVATPVVWSIVYSPLLCDETPYSVPVEASYSRPCITIDVLPYAPTSVAVPVATSTV